jgi:hypothetical protein
MRSFSLFEGGERQTEYTIRLAAGEKVAGAIACDDLQVLGTDRRERPAKSAFPATIGC